MTDDPITYSVSSEHDFAPGTPVTWHPHRPPDDPHPWLYPRASRRRNRRTLGWFRHRVSVVVDDDGQLALAFDPARR